MVRKISNLSIDNNRILRVSLLVVMLLVIAVVLLKVRILKSASIASPSGRLNIAVYSNFGAWVLAVEGHDKIINGVFIPPEVYIETANGAGRYKVAKLAKLARLTKDPNWFIQESLERFLRVPIDGFIARPEIQKTEDLSGIITIGDILKDNLKTNLPIWDRLLLWKILKTGVIREDGIIDISNTRAVQRETQEDKREVLVGSIELLPISIKQIFIEAELANEEISVIVFNATGTSSLAQITADIIENVGADVVRISNSTKKVAKCEISSSAQAKKTKSYRRLVQIFDCSLSREELENSSAQIEIYIGEEISRKYFGDQ